MCGRTTYKPLRRSFRTADACGRGVRLLLIPVTVNGHSGHRDHQFRGTVAATWRASNPQPRGSEDASLEPSG